MSARLGSLCTGYGGLELAVSAVVDAYPVWFAENDPAASAVLAHRWPGVPNCGDLTATDWSRVEPVDIVTAGWPCQPWSTAGRRRGAEDERAIWPAVATAVRHLRPGLVLLENVAAITRAGELARAVGDLAALRYDAVWACVRASDAGAPHRRERIFIAATDTAVSRRVQPIDHLSGSCGGEIRCGQAGSGSCGSAAAHTGHQLLAAQPGGLASGTASGQWHDQGAADASSGELQRRGVGGVLASPQGAGAGEGAQRHRDTTGDSCPVATHADGTGRQGPEPAGRRHLPAWSTAADADSDGLALVGQGPEPDPRHDTDRRSAVNWGAYAPAIHRWERTLGRPAPAPTVLGARGGRQLSPRFVEWLMGLPDGWVTAVPGLTRNQMLKLLGNGVVPQQGAAAFRHLLPLLYGRAAA